MYLSLILLPILGSIASGLFGRKIGVSGSQLITCTCVLITTFLAVVAFIEVGLNNIPVTVDLIRWIDVESLNVSWGFNFDSLTVSMLIPVLVVSLLVHVYSIGYMSHDPHNQRFFSYLSLFTFMMIILVTANNFLLMFVGWEGVGICSYLLVSFWFTRIAANQSSMSAFLTNRVGDCFLTIGMFAILWSFGNIDYYTVFSLAPYYSENVITLVGICLLIGAMAKSSQVGLHVWLPMAMEGPTPVSALIHAATMVTAGVYLLMRASPLIEYSSTVLILCLWVGAITTVFSSLVGLFQQDIKKVIAYSTMSQLGMMVIAIGLSSYNIALFHLVNHAFYKGLLFLGAGAVIHAVADNQDFRKYGGLISYLPLTYSVMLIASLSLVAIPFMTGFYSKDFILESAYGQYHLSSIIVYYIATTGAMFTTLYSVKVLYLTFLSNPNGPLVNYKQAQAAHEGDIFMSLPLIILAVFSIFFGYLTKDIFIGLASGFFSDNSLFIHPLHEIMLDTEFAVPTLFKLLPFFFTTSLILISLFFTEFYSKLLVSFKFSSFGYNIFSFFNQRFLVELFYNKYISGIILKLGGQTTKVMDKGLVELIGPYGLERNLTNLSRSINNLSTGVVTSYALYILIGLITYICVLYYSNFVEDFLEILLLILISLIYLTKNPFWVRQVV
jgi:NADH-ubiquinone oxidoreductase chain 5